MWVYIVVPNTLRWATFYFISYHTLASIIPEFHFNSMIFLRYTTVHTVSNQYFIGNFESKSMDCIVSNIVYILYSTSLFFWWAYAAVNSRIKPFLFLNSIHSWLFHLYSWSILILINFCLIDFLVFAIKFFSIFNITSIFFSLRI